VPELEFFLADDFAERQDSSPMVHVIRGFILLEAATFAVAALITVAGIFFSALGVGPRTAADIAYHAGIALVLLGGVIAAARSKP
jgi:hypothetical protein